MVELTLDFHRRARIWLSELPELPSPPLKYEQRDFATEPGQNPIVQKAAIELFIPSGGHNLYGLLGAEFVAANEASVLTVRVGVSVAPGALVTWSLARNLDEVRTGLPEEFREAIFRGVSRAAILLRPGLLLFDCSAHGMYGSCEYVFEKIGETLPRLMVAPPGSMSEEELSSLLNTLLRD